MKVLVIGPSWVGDMVMAQSLFRLLHQVYPPTTLQIDVLAPAWTHPLLARMPEIKNAHAMPVGHGELGLGKRLKLSSFLKTQQYDQAIVLPNSFKSALIPRFAKISKRTGWRGEARSWLLNDCRILDKEKYPLMVQRFAALAFEPDAELPIDLPRPALQIDEKNLASLLEKLSLNLAKEVLVLCPGAEFGPSKQWPVEHYAAVAKEALEQDKQVWILGSKKDQLAAGFIKEKTSAELDSDCHNLCGRTSLGEAIDLLSQAAAVVSNDSGLMHIAASLNRPLVVIYGSTSPAFTPPLASRVKMLSLQLDCSPCFKRECMLSDPKDHLRCLKGLGADKVNQALKDVIALSE